LIVKWFLCNGNCFIFCAESKEIWNFNLSRLWSTTKWELLHSDTNVKQSLVFLSVCTNKFSLIKLCSLWSKYQFISIRLIYIATAINKSLIRLWLRSSRLSIAGSWSWKSALSILEFLAEIENMDRGKSCAFGAGGWLWVELHTYPIRCWPESANCCFCNLFSLHVLL
jgi:hypothetical protein